ncbi:MAG TPA: histidine kinase N-terminal 7TM domain-containing protein, partial [Bacillota bacterium]|nr:histidine kinase N-terminal 7TM domain-containing protein [Bacillota bacterium]
WLLLCLNYVESRFNTFKNIAWLFSLPLFCFLTVLTNDNHHLFLLPTDRNFNQFGIFFFLHAFSSYLYCGLGAGIILNYAFREMRHLRPQAVLMIGAAVTPLVVNILTIFKVVNFNQFDFTPLSFNISSLILLIGIFKYKLLDVRPVALRKIMDHLKKAIVVMDNFGRIVEYNQPFLTTFPELGVIKPGERIEKLQDVFNARCGGSGLPVLTNLFSIRKTPATEEIFFEQTKQYFTVNIQPFWHGKVILGNVLSFNDVTEYRRLLEEVKEKNMELLVLNQQLKEQAAVTEELAVVKERNRLARDMHDTLGQTMTLVITMLQICQKNCLTNPVATQAKLEETMQLAVEGLEQTRTILYGLAGVTQQTQEIREILQTLLLTFNSFGIELTLQVEGTEMPLGYEISQTIYRLCQEALTNAIRHGRARQIGITVKFISERVFIEIINDGSGLVHLKRGMG